ncbi:MAG: hypothetical protein QGG84_01685 [Rhodospirillales bacterium]|jgi:lysophospholipase L1-like esterase|nr:hypothetical protein [Rhodospirillales bacterium]
MTVAVFVTETHVAENDLYRAKKIIEDRFATAGTISFEPLGSFNNTSSEIVVFVVNEMPDQLPTWQADQRVYHYQINRLDLSGRGPFQLIHPERFDEVEFPHMDTHVFNRLGPRQWGFANFPYGCLYLDPEVGNIDPFGFRVKTDFQNLKDRQDGHILITVFGGSAAFSVYCQYDEMFPQRLQDRLRKKFKNREITVLNFGMHDNVVMQEMLSYLMFVHELKPEIVISHSGHNDIWYGLRNDPYLVAKHNIIYQQHSEYWSYLLHGSGEMPPEEIPDELNLKQNVVKALWARYGQFQDVVTGAGGQFIWGLQPLIYSRTALHPREAEYKEDLDRLFRVDYRRRKLYMRVGDITAGLSEKLEQDGKFEFIDFHKIFGGYGDKFELLWDHVHASPKGDDEIARHYADYLNPKIENMLSGIT